MKINLTFVCVITWTYSRWVSFILSTQCTYKHSFWISNLFCLRLKRLSPGVWHCVFVCLSLCLLVALAVSEGLGSGVCLLFLGKPNSLARCHLATSWPLQACMRQSYATREFRCAQESDIVESTSCVYSPCSFPTAHTLRYAFSHFEYFILTNYQVQLDAWCDEMTVSLSLLIFKYTDHTVKRHIGKDLNVTWFNK